MSDIPVKFSEPEAPVILYAALDWGLGHTTRSIPVIRHLQQLGFKVVIACTAVQQMMLQQEFPGLQYEPLEGYAITFGRSRNRTLLRITLQVPRLMITVFREHQKLRGLQKRYGAKAIISDNRYGFYSKELPSIFLTHQLQIRSGISGWIDRLLQAATRFFLRRYDACWIPDIDSQKNLAGELSRPLVNSPRPLIYLGGLSRFNAPPEKKSGSGIIILLSGPEPQRSLLEQKICAQSEDLNQPIILVRGLPQDAGTPKFSKNITYYNHLNTESLRPLLYQSRYVISRSGYSSLMDYAALGCQPLLIPTPGQAEQEYLARYWNAMKWGLAFRQEDFDLKVALQMAAQFSFQPPGIPINSFRSNLEQSLRDLGLMNLV